MGCRSLSSAPPPAEDHPLVSIPATFGGPLLGCLPGVTIPSVESLTALCPSASWYCHNICNLLFLRSVPVTFLSRKLLEDRTVFTFASHSHD